MQMIDDIFTSDSDFLLLSPESTVPIQEESKSTKRKEKAKKPKRNRSAFIIFSSELRAQLKTKGEYNSNEMMTELANSWKALSKEERLRYEAKAAEDKKRYLREAEQFCETYPDKQIRNKTKNNHKKKPCSGYAIYVRENKDAIKEANPGLKMAAIFKIISQNWRNFSQRTKDEYDAQARDEKEKTSAANEEPATKKRGRKAKKQMEMDTTKRRSNSKDNKGYVELQVTQPEDVVSYFLNYDHVPADMPLVPGLEILQSNGDYNLAAQNGMVNDETNEFNLGSDYQLISDLLLANKDSMFNFDRKESVLAPEMLGLGSFINEKQTSNNYSIDLLDFRKSIEKSGQFDVFSFTKLFSQQRSYKIPSIEEPFTTKTKKSSSRSMLNNVIASSFNN